MVRASGLRFSLNGLLGLNGGPETRTLDLLVRSKPRESESKIYLVRLASLTDEWLLLFPSQYPILYPGHKSS
jgi:hypothetical protein